MLALLLPAERATLLSALAAHPLSRRAAASALGCSLRTLERRLRLHELNGAALELAHAAGAPTSAERLQVARMRRWPTPSTVTATVTNVTL